MTLVNQDFALRYASGYGWPVFPTRPGQKVPACTNGFTEATTCPETIEAWWTDDPDRGIGIRTGARELGGSGFFAVDIDVKDGALGSFSWDGLEDEHGMAPNTVSAITPSGGRHLLFECPDGLDIPCSASRVGKGVDIRGNGGYIVVAPSQNGRGEYTWDVSPKAARVEVAPDWLLALVVRAPRRHELPGDYTDTGKFPEGCRHARLLQFAGLLRDRGFPAKVINGCLLSANINLCDPPLDRREIIELGSDVATRYKPGHSIVSGGRPKKFALVTASQLRKRPAPKWLCYGLVVKNSLAAIVGHPATYKSFWALDLSLCVATGEHFAGRGVEKGSVVYIVAEGADGFMKRVDAWEKHRQQPCPEDAVAFVEEAVNITDPVEVSLFLSVVQRMEEPPSLVVIDTLNRCFGGAEENDASGMSRFIGGCDRIRIETGAAVLIVHHLNKQGGVRGSGALRAAVDTLFVAERIAGRIGVTNAPPQGKVKDSGELKSPLVFHPKEVDLGNKRESLVLRWWDPRGGKFDG